MTARLPLICASSALLIFAVYVALAMLRNNGAFEYALDDVYIHLAMAEQLFQGGYGVNAGEYASASSSPLFSFLLPTWAGMEAQRWLPFFWNIVALVSAAWLVGLALSQAGLGRLAVIVAIVAPLALAMHVAAFAGMENMAHGAASLAIVLGLWRFVETRDVGWLLIAGVVLAPALRLEGLALALAAAGVVFALGRWRAGLGLGLLALVPVMAFVVFLSQLGLDPLPNSVNAKLPDPGADEAGQLSGLFGNFAANIAQYGGRYVFALTLAVALLALMILRRGKTAEGLSALAAVAASLAHLAFASVGWMDRYENYLVLSLFAMLAFMVTGMGEVPKTVVLGVALAGGLMTYEPQFDNYISNPRAITLQQGQMARFAKEHVKGPVAVNDLGYVAWNNPDHVLDLWGLASEEALEFRLSENPPQGWVDALADAKGVRVAMIYPRLFPDALGADWVILGGLFLEDHGGPFLGGTGVLFYARNAAEAKALQPDLKDWAAGLPDGARFEFAGEGGVS